MFLKTYKLKSNAPLKSTEAKRLRQRLEKDGWTQEQTQALLPAKASVTILKLVTHEEFKTSVFCVDKVPMLFEIEGEVLVPTLYTLWLLPDLLPYFTTHRDVLPRLSNGADLMLPGVVPLATGMNMYGRYKKGQLMAINLTSNRAAVAVGRLPRSSDDLYMSGGRGTAVEILHIFGDKLWGHEPALTQQVPNWKTAALTGDDFPALGADEKKAKSATARSETPPSLASIVTQGHSEETNVGIAEIPNLSQLEIVSDVVHSVETLDGNATDKVLEEQIATPERVLKNAFLAALKNHGKSLALPLLTSNFYRLYVVPEAAQPIDLKKTKYKKLSNFLSEMIEEGFIVVREETKGVDKITHVDMEHPELVNFITDYKPSSVAGATATDGDGTEQPLFHSELTELYIVTDASAAFFTKLNYKRGEGIPIGNIAKIVREYISKEGLVTANPLLNTIKLDETLQQICGCEVAALRVICQALIQKMEHSYQMRSRKDVPTNKPLITMSLATRSGNKKVTLVSNVECYGIIMTEFVKLCKQGAAASTTMIKLPHQKREQLQIQGNQVRFIHNLLTETYKVPPKYILGLELAKDGKKKK